MPGDYSPRTTVRYECGHEARVVERSNAAQQALDVEYMRSHGYPDYLRPFNCPACVKAAKVTAKGGA